MAEIESSGPMGELQRALTWYDRKSSSNRLAYQATRVATIVLAASIPVVAAFGAPSEVAAVLGGVIVVIEAEHLCMSMRGVRKPGSSTTTSCVRGLFRDDMSSRMEAMRMMGLA